MTLKTRRAIFYTLFTIFIPLSLGVIFYSQGWRINFENFSVSKTGAIYIETSPKNVNIKLNNKNIPDQSGLIKNGTFISALLPKNYQIEIGENGYLAYRKNLKVEPSVVAELINVILIPQKIEKTEAIKKIKGDEIINSDAKRIIVKNPQNKTFYLYKFNEPIAAFNISDSFDNLLKKQEIIEDAALHPFNDDRLFIKTSNGLYVFDARKLQIETIFQNIKNNKLLAWSFDNSNVYLVKCQMPNNVECRTSAVYSYNLITKTENEILHLPENRSTVIKIKTTGSEIAFLDKSEKLSIFNVKEKNIRQIAENAKEFSFSPDGKKLFFLNNGGEINVYFIENWYKNSPKKSGEMTAFNLKNKKSIRNVYWHKNSYHLFIEYLDGAQKKIDFIEIDDRLPLNQYPLIDNFESALYNIASNLVYFVQNKTLYNIKI